MKNSNRPKTTPARLDKDRRQVAEFRKAARDLGCDDNEERFKDALRTVAKAKLAPAASKKDKGN
ncbi:MAG: hypothetical protein WB760_24325 [Xanthobacteraceae bacterium]